MIHLNRILPYQSEDRPEVFLDPAGIAAVVEHEGVTCVVMSGPQLVYNVVETPGDVLALRHAWFQRRSLIAHSDDALCVRFGAEGRIEFETSGYDQ